MNNSIILHSVSKEELKTIIEVSIKNAINNELPQPAPPEKEVFLTVKETAKYFVVSRQTIHSWRKKGLLPYYRIGGRVYFLKNELPEALRKIKYRKLS